MWASKTIMLCDVAVREASVMIFSRPTGALEQEPDAAGTDDRQDDGERQRHDQHLPVAELDLGRERRGQEEQEGGLAVRRGDRRDVGPGVDRDREMLELAGRDGTRLERGLGLVDEDRGHEDVVRDRAEPPRRREEREQAALGVLGERELHHGLEEPVVADHIDDAEEHHEQRHER